MMIIFRNVLTLLILFVAVQNVSAAVVKDDFEQKFSWRNHYYGTLGISTKITAYLTCMPGGRISGVYRYVRNGTPIVLSGEIKPNGELSLTETSQIKASNSSTKLVTGLFKGRVDPKLEFISGTWSSPDGSKSFPVLLRRGILVDYAKGEEQSSKGNLINSTEVSDVKSFCNAIGTTADDRRSRKSCIMINFNKIATQHGIDYFLASFQEKGKWSFNNSYIGNYTVLFEAFNGKFKPAWFYSQPDDGSSLESFKALNDEAGLIFQVTYNSGGTLPSWSDFILRRQNGLTRIDTNELEQAVSDIASKKGYATRNWLFYDFVKRDAFNTLYKIDDPNCCGTAEIQLKFELTGERLTLKQYKIKIDDTKQ